MQFHLKGGGVAIVLFLNISITIFVEKIGVMLKSLNTNDHIYHNDSNFP